MKKLKTLFALFATAITLSSYGFTPQDMTILCITEFPTTSFVGFSKKEKIEMRLVNSNGVKYMPISSQLITIHDLDILHKRAAALAQLGELALFDIPLKNCSIHQDSTFYCAGPAAVKTESKTSIEFVSLSSSIHSTKSSDVKYEQIQLTASFKIGGEYYDMMMKYSPNECGVHAKP